MGDVSDIEDLLSKWKKEKRGKLLWALATMAFTALSTTWAVSWKMSRFMADMHHASEELHGKILVMDKKVEKAEMEAAEAKDTAGKALLYAQLLGKKEN